MNSISKITIITAFFDIGRGNWSKDHGHPSYLKRTTEKYFDYFSNLSKLDNPIVVFCSSEHVDKIKKIRKEKSTKIIVIDFQEKFKKCRVKIEKIQDSEEFKAKINADQLKNPEYWSPDYVLVNNLKSYFVKRAITELNLKSDMIAWVDFGYCRDENTLNGLTTWEVNLDPTKVHFFTIKNKFKITEESVSYALLNNIPYIIGGVIIASKDNWSLFSELVLSCQKKVLEKNIVDDDQGIYLMCLLKKKEIFQLNYLGKNKWFDVFKKYDKNSKVSFKDKLKKILHIY